MRTRDRLRLLRALRRRRKRRKRKTRRRRKRRNKRDTTNSQEELPPNHLKNCSFYNQLPTFDCAPKNKCFVLILSWRCYLELKNIPISYIRDVCHHIKFSDAGVNWNPLDLKPNKR
jgi:hypothetical protein